MSAPSVNEDHIRAFGAGIFRYASDGAIISLRIFPDSDKKTDKALSIQAVPINGDGLQPLLDAAVSQARFAATHSKRAVFCPPLAGFADRRKADEASLTEGYVLSIECDQRPAEARRKLEAILGPPTFVVASGGQWINPETGEVEEKLHLHWRLTAPATGDDLKRLKELRRLAAELVDADRSCITVVHPLRWPGSVHRKREPRLSRIVAQSEHEIELGDALDLLREAAPVGQADGRPFGAMPGASSDLARGAPSDLQADVLDVTAALAVIPNDNDWWAWNRIGMAAWRASSGRAFAAFDAWSQKSGKYDPGATRARWDHYSTSQPDRIGAGTLFYLAREAFPAWKRPSDAARAPRNEAPKQERGETEEVITQDSVADLFAERHKNALRYCHSTGAWFKWTGSHWRRDEVHVAFQFARKLGRELSQGGTNRDLREIRRVTFAGGVERFAQSDARLAVTIDAWDQDPFVLGTPGVTVDLRTGKLRPADPADGITKLTAVAPAERADCRLWLKFLAEATGGDGELIQFVRQWCGYSLTGITREHALVFVYGPGGNGKSVFLNVLTGILGDYAATAAMDAFTASHNDKHPTDLAMLRGARLVTASETEDGRAWAESRIKQMTGGDPITARFMRMDFFTYQPQFKLTIVGNHKPALRNVDEAARRRFNIVPFTRKPAQPDRELEEKLKAEWPGILRWMIDGCLDWQAQGLKRPTSVVEETESYFADQDLLGHWIQEACDAELGNPYKSEPSGALYASWGAFAKASGEDAPSRRAFTDELKKRGFEPDKGAKGARIIRGIRLKPQPKTVGGA